MSGIFSFNSWQESSNCFSSEGLQLQNQRLNVTAHVKKETKKCSFGVTVDTEHYIAKQQTPISCLDRQQQL